METFASGYYKKDEVLVRKNRLDTKKNYDARLRKQSKVINEHEFVYVMVKRKYSTDHGHKLAQIDEGPCRVNKVDKTKVFLIERTTNRSVEKVSRSRVVLDPKPQTKKAEKIL